MAGHDLTWPAATHCRVWLVSHTLNIDIEMIFCYLFFPISKKVYIFKPKANKGGDNPTTWPVNKTYLPCNQIFFFFFCKTTHTFILFHQTPHILSLLQSSFFNFFNKKQIFILFFDLTFEEILVTVLCCVVCTLSFCFVLCFVVSVLYAQLLFILCNCQRKKNIMVVMESLGANTQQQQQ